MLNVTNAFKAAMESNIKGLGAWIVYFDDNEEIVKISDTDALVSIKISSDGELGASCMRKLEASFIKSKVPESFSEMKIDDYFEAVYGVEIDGVISYENAVGFGSFKIVEIKNTEEDETISWIAYDLMYDTIVPYEDFCPNADYWIAGYDEKGKPIPLEHTLVEYLNEVLNIAGINLGTTNFALSEYKLDADRYVSTVENTLVPNIPDFKVRDLINEICKISGTIALFSNDDKLHFKKLGNIAPVYTMDLNKLIKFKKYDRYGPINKVVLTREPQQEEPSIRELKDTQDDYGVNEWKVANNQLIDYQPIIDPIKLKNYDPENNPIPLPIDNREEVIDEIFEVICGTLADASESIVYYPFEAETSGYGWFEIGDKIKFTSINGDVETLILSYSMTLDGGISETLSARKTNKTDTKSKYSQNRNFLQTQLIVDKQNQAIIGTVEKNYKDTKTFTQQKQTNEGFSYQIYKSGGYNLLQNSVMKDYDKDKETGAVIPKIWTLSHALNPSDLWQLNSSISTSGHGFVLDNNTATQTATMTLSKEKSFEERPCTLSFKYGKFAGTAYYRIQTDSYDSGLKYLLGGTVTGEMNSDNIISQTGIITVSLFGDSNTQTLFTDVILCETDKGRNWVPGIGEVLSQNVIINNSGVRVRGNNNLETVLTDSSLTCQNKDDDSKIQFKVTTVDTKINNVKTNSFVMPPLKIVNYNNGWTIVATNETFQQSNVEEGV